MVPAGVNRAELVPRGEGAQFPMARGAAEQLVWEGGARQRQARSKMQLWAQHPRCPVLGQARVRGRRRCRCLDNAESTWVVFTDSAGIMLLSFIVSSCHFL